MTARLQPPSVDTQRSLGPRHAPRHQHLRIPGPSDLLGRHAVIVVGVALGALAVLAHAANHTLLSWDEPVARVVRGVHAHWFAVLMHAATQFGNRYILAPLTLFVAVLLWPRSRRFAIVFFAALPAAFALEFTVKAGVARPRPDMAHGFGSSFPSGHVIAATVFWGLLPPAVYLLTERRRAWLASIAVALVVLAAVGASRIYIGDHWPSDVLGGYLGGAIFLFVGEWALRHPTMTGATVAPGHGTSRGATKPPLRKGKRR
jgi:undecaprenyl-diphosphatase